MTNTNDVRRAHELLDDIFNGYQLNSDSLDHLRSFLPELPKQKTLEEVAEHVCDAWVIASGDEWGGNSYNTEISLEDWLSELHIQLQGLKDAPATVPALPAGMRIADHETYGRVVVSPGLNDFGLYLIFVLDSDYKEGAHWHCEHGRTLTFIDAEPAKPAHPEFLETEADYENAPEGTVVARDGLNPWVKEESVWVQGSAADSAVYTVPCLKGPRRILRWGDK